MDKLKSKIDLKVFERLIKANFRSIPDILASSKIELMQATQLDRNCIEKICLESANIILSGKIKKASQISKWKRISTGCPSLDAVTRGGIAVHGITEIVGCSGVGKTQFCLHLSLMTQLPDYLGGLGKSVVYICTEDVFPAKRLKELASTFSLKCQINFEDNIFIEHIADVGQLKRCLSISLPKLLLVKNIGLIVIDSIAGIFRSENLDVSYTNRSQDFITVVTMLNQLSTKHEIAIVCVNQVTDNTETNTTEPCLGLAWGNNITYRFNITRFLKHQIREFEVVFAPDLPNKTAQFTITKEGLNSV